VLLATNIYLSIKGGVRRGRARPQFQISGIKQMTKRCALNCCFVICLKTSPPGKRLPWFTTLLCNGLQSQCGGWKTGRHFDRPACLEPRLVLQAWPSSNVAYSLVRRTTHKPACSSKKKKLQQQGLLSRCTRRKGVFSELDNSTIELATKGRRRTHKKVKGGRCAQGRLFCCFLASFFGDTARARGLRSGHTYAHLL